MLPIGRAFALAAVLTVSAPAFAPASAALFAQATDASIRGLVTDTADTPLGGGIVEIRNLSSGFSSSVRTSARGRFSASQLPLGGPYRVTVRAIGFRPRAREGITLNIGSTATADFRLSVSTAQLQDVTIT